MFTSGLVPERARQVEANECERRGDAGGRARPRRRHEAGRAQLRHEPGRVRTQRPRQHDQLLLDRDQLLLDQDQRLLQHDQL